MRGRPLLSQKHAISSFNASISIRYNRKIVWPKPLNFSFNDKLLLQPLKFPKLFLFLPLFRWKMIQFWWHFHLTLRNKISFLKEMLNERSKLTRSSNLHNNLSRENHHTDLLQHILYLDWKFFQAFSCCKKILKYIDPLTS